MRKDLITMQPLQSSFFSCQKDTEKVLRTLFVESKPYSDILKRLLLINKPDCLDMDNQEYKQYIDKFSIGRLQKQGYIRLNPKIVRKQYEGIKSFIILRFGNFVPSKNPQYRDYTMSFDVVCYTDEWVLDNYQVRPLKICGYIDGILNTLNSKNRAAKKTNGNFKLSGIGQYSFTSGNEVILNEQISMYTISYQGLHFSDDREDLNDVVESRSITQ